jgi:hypothetical protein
MDIIPTFLIRNMKIRLGCLVCAVILMGCNYASERIHPDYADYRQQIRRVLVLPPEIGIFEETVKGSMAWQVEKSRSAQQMAFKSVVGMLSDNNYTVKSTGLSASQNEEIQSIKKLFRSVNRSIQLHTYGPQIYPSKLKEFNYEIGPVNAVLDAYQADALVLVIGHQTVSSKRPKTWISIAVVEPGGKIIWYGMQGAKQNLDLQAHSSASALIVDTLAPFLGCES